MDARNRDFSQTRAALVLPGGGARGAFQVGVLKALGELLPRGSSNPFRVISGTSAGAITSVVLASKARRFQSALAELEQVWGGFHCDQVYRTDNLTMLKSSTRWLAAILFGGLGVESPSSLLDNAPLRALLSRNVRFPRIQEAIDRGWLDAVAITAAGYSSAQSMTFFQSAAVERGWSRTRRVGVQSTLNLDHLMASIAVPIIFPPVLIDGQYFGDGAMRQATPLSPAVHLGADRILVIGVRNEVLDKAPDLDVPPPSPTIAQIAGYTLDTLFMDGLYSDLERLTRINQLIDAVEPANRHGIFESMRPVDTMLIVPSVDLRVIAQKHRAQLPFALRTLLNAFGEHSRSEGRLLSFLLFESAFTRELIELGYHDAMLVRNQLLEFVMGAPVPRLFAPEWVKRDLRAFG